MESKTNRKTFTKEHTNIAKGFAIMLLLMYHLFFNEFEVNAMAVNYAPLSEKAFSIIANFGNVCVSIFVFLTSYGIAKGIYNQDNLDIKSAYQQAIKRFLKLMLNFFLLYISVIIVMFPHLHLKELYGWGGQGALRMLTDALGLHGFFGINPLNVTWWYMGVAYILIFLVPTIVFMSKKLGYTIIPLFYFLPFVFDMNHNIERFLLVAVIGVCAAKGAWIDKVLEWKVHLSVKWIIGIVGLILCVIGRQKEVIQESYLNVADAFISLFLVCMTTVIIGSIPGIRKVFSFLGRHSMNMYLVHTFFYMNIWRKEIYQFKYAIVTWLFLLLASLGYSIFLESIKKLVKWIYQKIKASIKSKKKAKEEV